MIQQNYNVTDWVNHRADAKWFTDRRCKTSTCQFLDGANSSVNSGNDYQSGKIRTSATEIVKTFHSLYPI